MLDGCLCVSAGSRRHNYPNFILVATVSRELGIMGITQDYGNNFGAVTMTLAITLSR